MIGSALQYQRRVAKMLLEAIGPDGFALAGSSAIREHGLTERPTEDVDLFTFSTTTTDQFHAALSRGEEALRQHGYRVARTRSFPVYARLHVEDPEGAGLDVDLGVDWRQEPPVAMKIGPVLAANDAVAGKVGAVYSRGEVRDFLDLDSIRQSGRFTDTELLRLGKEHDDGLETSMFADQLARVVRISASEVSEYGVDPGSLEQVKQRLLGWSAHLHEDAAREPAGPPPARPIAPHPVDAQEPRPRVRRSSRDEDLSDLEQFGPSHPHRPDAPGRSL